MKSITLEEMTCSNCGTTYGVDATLIELRKEDGKLFYCPNGHGQLYTNSKAARLEAMTKELADTKEELNDTRVENRRLKCEALARQPPRQARHALWDQ